MFGNPDVCCCSQVLIKNCGAQCWFAGILNSKDYFSGLDDYFVWSRSCMVFISIPLPSLM